MKKYFIKISLFLFFLLIYIYIIYYLRDWFIDDSYITLTYSRNLALHGKPWYNLDDYYQGNGQTSILWMLIQSIFFLFKIPIGHEKLNLLINFALGIFLLIKFSQLINISKLISLYNVAVLSMGILFSYWLGFNSHHGLETVFFTFFLFLFLANWNNKKSLLWSFFLCLIRPEAVIFNIFYILDSKIFSKNFFLKLTVTFFSLVTFLLYTYFFYDYLIPLPFVLKSIKVFNFIKVSKFLTFLFIFSPILFYLFYNKKKFLFYAPLFILLVYYSFFIDEVMNVVDRYEFPLSIYLYFFLKDIKGFQFKYNEKLRVVYKIALFLSIIFCIKYLFKLDSEKYFCKTYARGMETGAIYVGKYFHKIKNIKIATSDAGAIAFFSNATCYDLWGLNDATLLLTKKKKNYSQYMEYLKSKNLDYIVLISTDKEKYTSLLDFENKIYDYFGLENSPIILKAKFGENYYYFCYKIK